MESGEGEHGNIGILHPAQHREAQWLSVSQKMIKTVAGSITEQIQLEGVWKLSSPTTTPAHHTPAKLPFARRKPKGRRNE